MKLPHLTALTLLAAGSALAAGPLEKTDHPAIRFVPHEIAANLKGGYMTIAADLNKDGKPDIVALASGMQELAWYENPTWTRHVLAGGFTTLINVAAADLDGDGIPELAVASGFSMRAERSQGNVSLLTHGVDPREPWSVREIDRVPASHRLRWYAAGNGETWLIDAPLTGPAAQAPDYRGATPIYFYRPPDWKRELVSDQEEGIVHAVEPVRWEGARGQVLLSAGFTGIHRYQYDGSRWQRTGIGAGDPAPWPKSGSSDVAVGHIGKARFLAAIEPWHGNNLVIYHDEQGQWRRQVLDPDVVDGHTLVVADVDGDGRDEIMLGQRQGPKSLWMYHADATGHTWTRSTIDDAMAASGCASADFNGDRRIDIVCISGTTLKWYENAGDTARGGAAGR